MNKGLLPNAFALAMISRRLDGSILPPRSY